MLVPNNIEMKGLLCEMQFRCGQKLFFRRTRTEGNGSMASLTHFYTFKQDVHVSVQHFLLIYDLIVTDLLYLLQMLHQPFSDIEYALSKVKHLSWQNLP